jgi:hypothetical protein
MSPRTLDPLSDADLDRLALDVPGTRRGSPLGSRPFLEHGATLGRRSPSPDLVDALDAAPSWFTIFDRGGEPAMSSAPGTSTSALA